MNGIDTLLLDGDGVLWEADVPMPGLSSFFSTLTQLNFQWGLVTNNATKTIDEYVRKFEGFGITVSPEQIFSSAVVTAEYLKDHVGRQCHVYVIGQQGLVNTLETAGHEVITGDYTPSHVDAVVVGVDRAITYGKIRAAMRFIRKGARFIATNPDPTFPTSEGLDPGAGSIIAAVTVASGVQPLMMGKPEPEMFNVALSCLSASIETTAMVGDRLDTDIAGANRLGLYSILVLSGVTHRADLTTSSIQPRHIVENIEVLADHLNGRLLP